MSSDGDANWAIPSPPSLPEMVSGRVVEAIRTGVLRPGERIIEADLARKLGVSRGSLREALKALEAVHLVEHRRSRGTFVSQASPEQAMQMIAVRAALEGLAARLVAGERKPAVMQSLQAKHAEMRADAEAGRVSDWREHDWQFHEMVCRASGNEFLLRAWSSMSNLVRLFLHDHPAYEREAEDVLQNHDRLMAALRSGDPADAGHTFQTVILRSGVRRLGVAPPPGLEAML